MTTNEKQLKKRSFKSQTGREGALASSAAFPTKHKCFYFPVSLVFVSSQNALNSSSFSAVLLMRRFTLLSDGTLFKFEDAISAITDKM